MVQAKWGTPPITEWLHGRFPALLDAQKAKKPHLVTQFHKETRDLFFQQWTPEREADEWAEAERKAVEIEEAEMLAANRTKLTAAQTLKRESREKEAKERVVYATYESWKGARTPVSIGMPFFG